MSQTAARQANDRGRGPWLIRRRLLLVPFEAHKAIFLVSSDRWRTIEELYHPARERAPGDRESFLAGACGGDGALKAEIERLLAQDSGGHMLDMPAAEVLLTVQLAVGARLGRYEILSSLGRGGMGVVWKARDTRLNRTVAIKVSSERFSERFEREARAISALNHAHICTLYDVGPDYLVMEYVEGAPLAPVDSTRKLLDIAVQMSDGLAAAHAAGIVHRDLKPDNILLTRDGRIKILDFGLAKAAHAEIAPGDATLTNLTDPGTTLGTVAYMSPEQACGIPGLTAQSDQFSLGLVLYELATGKRAFRRGSAAETMTAIIREEPEALPASLPAPLRWIIERLLAKEPAERYDSTRDLYRELRQVRDGLAEASQTLQSPSPAKPRTRGFLPAGLVVAVLAGAPGWMLRPDGNTGQYRFSPMEVSLENPTTGTWSPDGRAFVYAAGAAGQRRIFLRYLSASSAAPLTRPAALWNPISWSPDGKRVFMVGLNPQGSGSRALFSVPVFGGEPELIRPVEAVGTAPTVSPDGKTYAELHRAEGGKYAVFTAFPLGSPLKRYAPAPFESATVFNVSRIRFSPDGRWLTLLQDVPGGKQAWKLPYPAGQSAPRRFLEDLKSYGGTPQLSWFPGGRTGVIARAEGEGQAFHLWSVGVRSGVGPQITSGVSGAGEAALSVSPDGRILFVQGRSEYRILSASLSDAVVEPVITSEMRTGMPAWALHQEKFVYESDRNGTPAIWMRADGWDRLVVASAAFPPGSTAAFMTPALSPGADRLVFTRIDRDQRNSNWISSVSGGPPVRLTNVKDATEFGGSWSPDGQHFAYLQIRDNVRSVDPPGRMDELREMLPW